MTTLPIDGFATEIVRALGEKDILVLRGQTGSGKSTRIGPILHGARYRVTVTQPRRMPAWSVARHVARTMRVPLGGLVGWKTGDGGEVSGATRVEFVTDGLLRKRLVSGHLVDISDRVYVVDEVHERSVVIDTLLALLKREKERGAKFKVVLMSATIEPSVFAEYFGGPDKVAVVDVPGRTYPVEMANTTGSLEGDVTRFVAEGRHVLAFVPSVQEAKAGVARLKDRLPDAMVLPLYADLEPAEQDRVFTADKAGRPVVIVSTPVAQTSLTIPYVDAVVDTGLEYREEIEDGVQGLGRRPISWACVQQRVGRAGRTKPGVATLVDPYVERPKQPAPEILRVALPETVLDLLRAGVDIRDLALLDAPPTEEVDRAYATLRALGFIEGDRPAQVTADGGIATIFPVDCHIDRMIIEAAKRGCVSEVIEIAAILQVGGVRDSRPEDAGAWDRLVGAEAESDLLAHHRAYLATRHLTAAERMAHGVHSRQVDEAMRVIAKLVKAIGRIAENGDHDVPTATLLKCVAAGMVDHLYHRTMGAWYKDCDRETAERRLDRESALTSSLPEWVVGVPYNIGRAQIIQLPSAIDPAWMLEVAPHLCERRTDGTYFRGYRIGG